MIFKNLEISRCRFQNKESRHPNIIEFSIITRTLKVTILAFIICNNINSDKNEEITILFLDSKSG